MSADNIAKVKSAYQAWHDCKGGNCGIWHALVHEDVSLNPIGGTQRGLEFTQPGTGRAQLTAYLDSLTGSWTMNYFEPEVVVADGDRVAMFGRTSWTFKETGKVAVTPIAHLWRFENGLAVEFTEIFDSAAVAAAAQP